MHQLFAEVSKEELRSFARVLKRLLANKYQRHWHLDDPQRGCGFRAISNQFEVDSSLSIAADLIRNDFAHV